MKFIVLLASTLLFRFAQAQGNIDVLHYRFDLELNDQNDSIYGQAQISFIKKGDASKITLDLENPNKGKGMLVVEIREQKAGVTIPIKDYEHAGEKIILPSAYFKKADTSLILIYYKGIPSDGLIISKNKYGSRTFFADNWPDRAHKWLPCVDDPGDKASVEFGITAPGHYQVVSNGILVEETNLPDNRKITRWREDVPLPTKVMVIGVAEFAVGHAGFADCVPVSSWVYPQDKYAGFYDYALATEILKFYTGYIGPYPYKKLANVQSKTIFGGMENAGAIFYYENSVTGKRTEEPLLAHEIVHQWFGNMATEKKFAHLWLSEGFATYLTHVYLQSKFGDSVFSDRLREDRQQVLQFGNAHKTPVVDSVSRYMQLLNPNSYQKGSWVLHMLRGKTGDSIFKMIIRTYYDRFKGKNADTEDFRKVAEEISGLQLKKFFQQWLYTSVNPELHINWKHDKKSGRLIVTVVQQQSPEFDLDLELVIKFPKGRTMTVRLPVNKRTSTFSYPVSEVPSGITADPNTKLLFQYTVKAE